VTYCNKLNANLLLSDVGNSGEMMAKRNQHSSVVPDTCPLCGDPTGKFIVASTARFKSNKKHTTNDICENCRERISKMAEILAAGGVMIVCTQCDSLTAELTVPESLQQHITQLPDGTKRLEMAGCPLCQKGD
jgi:4-hydroxy-3-methylbut-2-enyl diphosphate reductase IspH